MAKIALFCLSDFSMGKGGAAELGGIGLKPWLPLIFLENRNSWIIPKIILVIPIVLIFSRNLLTTPTTKVVGF